MKSGIRNPVPAAPNKYRATGFLLHVSHRHPSWVLRQRKLWKPPAAYHVWPPGVLSIPFPKHVWPCLELVIAVSGVLYLGHPCKDVQFPLML